MWHIYNEREALIQYLLKLLYAVLLEAYLLNFEPARKDQNPYSTFLCCVPTFLDIRLDQYVSTILFQVVKLFGADLIDRT